MKIALIVIISVCAACSGNNYTPETIGTVNSYDALEAPLVTEIVDLGDGNRKVTMLCSQKHSKNRSSLGYRAKMANAYTLSALSAAASIEDATARTEAIKKIVAGAASIYGCAPTNIT